MYQLDIRLLPNTYYLESFTTGAITMSDPGTGFTTGGGWLASPPATGLLVNRPEANGRANFGFTVKYLKNGSIQGNSLYVYRDIADLGGGQATATITTTSGKMTSTTTVNAPAGERA